MSCHHKIYAKGAAPKLGKKYYAAEIALVGNPNTGKSCLFNQLTGMDAVVSNYPGTTVDILEGKSIIGNKKVIVADLPGIYTLGSASDDEKAATDYIIQKKPAVVVNILDATLLERNLYLTLQLLELKIPLVIALNFYEELEDKQIRIDCKKLSSLLGVPVIPIDAVRGAGIPNLVQSIDSVMQGNIKLNHYVMHYDDHIEKAASAIAKIVDVDYIPKLAVAVRLIEEDEEEYKKVGDKGRIRNIIKKLFFVNRYS